jgi:hypothetical protein
MSRLAPENKTLFLPPEISVSVFSKSSPPLDGISLTDKGSYAKYMVIANKNDWLERGTAKKACMNIS